MAGACAADFTTLFSIEVDRAVKAIAGQQKKLDGIALRIVPDRGLDDGYTVRCRVSPAEKAYLESEIYAN